ncbi:MAG: hypothetical protein ACRDPC_23610, partial [Solirubrobacteraceae bacterium]
CGPHHGALSPATLGPLAGSAALLAAFVAVERRVAVPVVRLGIFRVPQLTGANLALAANAGGFTGMMFLSTLYMQRSLGLSALETGLRGREGTRVRRAPDLDAPRRRDRAGGAGDRRGRGRLRARVSLHRRAGRRAAGS